MMHYVFLYVIIIIIFYRIVLSSSGSSDEEEIYSSKKETKVHSRMYKEVPDSTPTQLTEKSPNKTHAEWAIENMSSKSSGHTLL